jgi:hypothetical protein
VSPAVALIGTVAGAVNVAPLAGLVSDTVGGWLFATVIERAADVVVAPALSRATAVREYVPAATFDHVRL